MTLLFQILAFEEPIRHAPLVMLDSNISQEAIDHACSFCGENHIPGNEIVLHRDSCSSAIEVSEEK